MADIGWRRRRGSSPAARTGARQRAGLTPPPPPTHFHASGRRFTHNSSAIKKSIDSDHGIYRHTGGTSSRSSAARRLRGRSRRARSSGAGDWLPRQHFAGRAHEPIAPHV